jgi:hypothetical protein
VKRNVFICMSDSEAGNDSDPSGASSLKMAGDERTMNR